MSAYAMPGAIFPPTSGFTFMSNETISPNSTTDCQEKDVSNNALSNNFHIEPISFSAIIASDITSSPNPLQTLENTKTESNNQLPGHSKELDISVKEAKIDPMRLMESLTSPQKNRKRETTSYQIENDSLCGANPQDDDDDPHKNAIEFELKISLNGRTYTAKRTLPRIIQLRTDLISEMKNRSRKLQQMRWLQRRNHNRKYSVDDDDMTVQTVDAELDDDDDDDSIISIPELPQYFNEEEEGSSGGSFAARGFSKLQILMRSYRPVIERWLLRVTDIVSPTESRSLSTFLWEPLSEIWLEPIEEDLSEEGSDTSLPEQCQR